MVDEKYSPQAEMLMKNTIEDFEEDLREVKATDANLNVVRGLRINIQGKPRRLVDVGDLKKTGDPNKYSEIVTEMTMEKIKQILGTEYFEKYKTEELDFL